MKKSIFYHFTNKQQKKDFKKKKKNGVKKETLIISESNYNGIVTGVELQPTIFFLHCLGS